MITGVKIGYYFHCKRQLWFFSNHIQMEQEDLNVSIGKNISENTYKRNFHEVEITDYFDQYGIKIDFIDHINGIVHEIKKTEAFADAHKWQLLFYIYILKSHGFNFSKGVIDYPKLRKTTDVVLDELTENELLSIISDIESICSSLNPLSVNDANVKKSVCKKCSYFELCFAD